MIKAIFASMLVLPFAVGCSKATNVTSATDSPGSSVVGASKGQTFTFARTYKVGDKDAYNVKMEQSTGNVVITMTMTQEITKVYDNGDADMSETSSDMVMNMGGKDTKVPPQPPVTMKVDKYGSPVGGDKGGPGAGYGAALSQIKNGISVGQTVPYEFSNPAMPGSHDTGKITYVSADGPSKFHIVSDITDPKGGKSHVEGDMTLDTVSKKPISMDLTITTAGDHPNTSHMVMTLKTS